MMGMVWSDYKELISLEKIKAVGILRGITIRAMAEASGYSESHFWNVLEGRFIPDTEHIAKLCAFLECSVDDVVEFYGYEVKEIYTKKDPFIEHTPKTGEIYTVSYEPLRNLILYHYGQKNYNIKMTELLNKIPVLGSTEKQRENMQKVLQGNRERFKEKGVLGTGGVNKLDGGIGGKKKMCFKHDRPLNMRYVYSLCKLLGCTPAWVMTYK